MVSRCSLASGAKGLAVRAALLGLREVVGRYGDEVDVAFVLRRLGTPDDMAVAVVYVATPTMTTDVEAKGGTVLS